MTAANRHLMFSFPPSQGDLNMALNAWDASRLLTARMCLGSTLAQTVNFDDALHLTALAAKFLNGQTTRNQKGASHRAG